VVFVPAQVLDARDPEGTRCKFIEQHIRKNSRHKHLLLLLNKCDLVSVTAAGCVLRFDGWVCPGV
jgi:nuclear GTP-binding protein